MNRSLWRLGGQARSRHAGSLPQGGEILDPERFGRMPVHFGIIYWALHSLSHAFMTELALECGYPLSSLKERIYTSGSAQAERFGILSYTSTSGGQGTLGGLSSMAHQAGDLLARATKHLALCSNDPICTEQSTGKEDYPLQGAACHACLLVPETSCEARNSRLDRALLTQTVLGSGSPIFPKSDLDRFGSGRDGRIGITTTFLTSHCPCRSYSEKDFFLLWLTVLSPFSIGSGPV